MMFNDNVNYTILANNVNTKFLDKFREFIIIDSIDYNSLIEKIKNFPSKRIVFNEVFYNLSSKEIEEVMRVLKLRNISFVIITSNVEYSLYSDYVVVYDGEEKVLEGNTKQVLRNEKILKKIGYGLPFVVDLSIQLNYYEVFKEIYYDLDALMEALWN